MDLSLAIDEPLLKAVKDIASRLDGAGGRAYMVGGAVRDVLLGEHVKDVDIEVFGLEPNRVREILSPHYGLDAVGLSFGVLKVHDFDIDIALPRRESKSGEGHRAFDIKCDPSLPIEEAAKRRDFTINAIYYDLGSDEIVDPFGGTKDLKDKVLRHVSEHFAEDPLRVLRGMQFVARFDLTAASETIGICRSMTIENLPQERLFEEWSKLVTKGVKISKGLNFLRAVGWTRYFPELKALIGCKQNPEWHPEGDVWNHTCCCMDAFARDRDRRGRNAQEDEIVGLAVLCHDFGKPAATRFVRGKIRALGHDVAGKAPTLSFLMRLTNEERILKDVVPLVTHHMAPFSLWKGKAGDASVRRLAVKVGRIDRLVRVAKADDEGRPPFPAGGEELDWLVKKAEELRIAASVPKPILQGRDLIRRGFKPSPRFGKILKDAYEAQLDGKFGDIQSAGAWLTLYVRHMR